MEELDGAPGSCLRPGLALVLVGIWAVNQWMKVVILCVCVCVYLSNEHINKTKEGHSGTGQDSTLMLGLEAQEGDHTRTRH